ncbi:MAG: nucleotide sugar dehydrogenase [Bacillota bacterium]
MLEKMDAPLLEKIENHSAKVAVVGLGYVGLPTAALFANQHYQVLGVDVNAAIVEKINNCKLDSKELGLEDMVNNACKKGYFKAVVPPSAALKDVDVIIACVQTPVDDRGRANLAFLKSAVEEIARNLTRSQLVIIQSTVPPKTIETVVLPILQEKSGLRCGSDFWLSYCPERLAPGNGLEDFMMNSRLIGAYDQESAALSKALFQSVTKGTLVVTDIGSAEISKLAENTFRFINIAFANELARICKEIDVDVKEVIRLANTHPRVNIHNPGAGAGGPCLTKDSKMLLNTSKIGAYKATVIPAAIKVNADMPRYIAELAIDGLHKAGKKPSKCKVVVFGTAYKGDVDDPRDSPSKTIISTLQEKHVPVFIYDPICTESFGAKRVLDFADAVKSADCIILATEHRQFYDLNLLEIGSLMNKQPIIVDAKRIINPAKAKSYGFQYLATSSVLQSNYCSGIE